MIRAPIELTRRWHRWSNDPTGGIIDGWASVAALRQVRGGWRQLGLLEPAGTTWRVQREAGRARRLRAGEGCRGDRAVPAGGERAATTVGRSWLGQRAARARPVRTRNRRRAAERFTGYGDRGGARNRRRAGRGRHCTLRAWILPKVPLPNPSGPSTGNERANPPTHLRRRPRRPPRPLRRIG